MSDLTTTQGEASRAGAVLRLNLRRRVERVPGSGAWEAVTIRRTVPAAAVALLLCDVWDDHWCRGAARRVDAMAPVMNEVVAAARAHGLDVIDGVCADFRDGARLEAECRQARALGFDGKWCIHPSQIAIVNEVFSPARDQWERAEAMLAAYDEAHAAGRGAAMFDGEMIDEANRKMAQRIAEAGRAAGYAGS